MSRRTENFPPEDHPLNTFPKNDETILTILPVEVFLMSMATQLDLKSLGALIRVSSQTRNMLDGCANIWKLMLISFYIMPEKNKKAKDYKARVKLFVDIPAHCEFFINKLKMKENISFEKSKAFHTSIIDTRNALKNFSTENPQPFFKALYQFSRTLPEIVKGGKSGYLTMTNENLNFIMEGLCNRYGKIELGWKAILDIAEFSSNFFMISKGFCTCQLYQMTSFDFYKSMMSFVINFTGADQQKLIKVSEQELGQQIENIIVLQSSPYEKTFFSKALYAVHKAVGTQLEEIKQKGWLALLTEEELREKLEDPRNDKSIGERMLNLIVERGGMIYQSLQEHYFPKEDAPSRFLFK